MAEKNLDGAAYAVFAVVLSEASEKTISISWHTEDGTGKAGTDYAQASGTVTFAPGETLKSVQVLVYGRSPEDSTEERTFSLRLDPDADVILNNDSTTECRIEVKTLDGAVYTSIVVARGPKGKPGDGGLTAYELAKLQGFMGTLSDWLDKQRGEPGKNVELRATDEELQWRREGDTEWLHLMPRSALSGREIELKNDGTDVRWRYIGDTAWKKLAALADLKGDKGDKGDTGAGLQNKGEWVAGDYLPGDFVVAAGSTADQAIWILKDTEKFTSAKTPKQDVAHWVELVPPKGLPGTNGRELEVQKGATHLQCRYVGETEWKNLIALADLKGKDGNDGASGAWLSGSGAPAAANGTNGQMYLDTAAATNGDVYLKSAGAWSKVGNIRGPAATGGGGSVTFATTKQAQDADSTTVAMSPARVREFMEQFGLAADYTTTSTDLDLVLKGQLFNYSATTKHRPGGAGKHGRGICIPSGGGYSTQLAIENDSNKLYIRYQTANTWGDWAPAVGADSGGGGGGGASDVLPALLTADVGANSAALADALSWNVTASTVYSVRILMPYRTTGGKGIAVGFGGTAGFQTLALYARGTDAADALVTKLVKEKGAKAVFPTSKADNDNLLVVEGLIYPTTSGTFTFQIAQAAAGDWCAAEKGTAGALEPVGVVPATRQLGDTNHGKAG